MSKKDWSKFKEENEQENEIESPETDLPIEEEQALDYESPEEIKEKLILAEQEALKNRENAMRAMAELDNVRKRAENDVAKAHKFALEKFITNLLPVIDSLEQALEAAKKEKNAAMIEGIELTLQLFLSALAKSEVTQINPEGEMFNPQEHEAISMQESEAKANTVLVVFQKGYRLHDRVIRPARVIVSKPKA